MLAATGTLTRLSGLAQLDLPWLSGHQLAQRIAVSELKWTGMELHPHIPGVVATTL
ncbi:hypothetical protein [Nonomuraea aurantiaca]|jgi:hypothetical protein|uniref:hypothetical protein n=1 Tax=Nonomuraea aurantiaca TaxID=2878562 RepID=UPI001CD9A852|nr:hypothetical protein [Nonomuraea aurantiaca]MCA2222921.1 hypothetical protein [Nonomuraea aurantiaca]